MCNLCFATIYPIKDTIVTAPQYLQLHINFLLNKVMRLPTTHKLSKQTMLNFLSYRVINIEN